MITKKTIINILFSNAFSLRDDKTTIEEAMADIEEIYRQYKSERKDMAYRIYKAKESLKMPNF